MSPIEYSPCRVDLTLPNISSYLQGTQRASNGEGPQTTHPYVAQPRPWRPSPHSSHRRGAKVEQGCPLLDPPTATALGRHTASGMQSRACPAPSTYSMLLDAVSLLACPHQHRHATHVRADTKDVAASSQLQLSFPSHPWNLYPELTVTYPRTRPEPWTEHSQGNTKAQALPCEDSRIPKTCDCSAGLHTKTGGNGAPASRWGAHPFPHPPCLNPALLAPAFPIQFAPCEQVPSHEPSACWAF